MNPKLRDNLIYSAVGLGFVALLVVDFIYSETHHTRMWMPSRFAFRAATTPGVLAYFVIQQMRSERASVFQTLGAVAVAVLLQLAIMLRFRQIIDHLPGITYSAGAIAEMFFVWLLAVRGARYLIGQERGDRRDVP